MGNKSFNKRFISESASVETKAIRFRNYFLVILFILYEDSPFFMHANKQIFWFILFVLLLLLNLDSRKVINQKIFLVIISVWFIILFQFLIFGGITPAGLYKPILIFFTPFLVYSLMGVKYFKYLFNVIFFIAVYTSVIYLLHTLIPSFNKWLLSLFDAVFPYSWDDWARTILVYSRPRESGYFFMRNSGVFHEPGAYSIYLMLAIIINTFYTRRPLNRKNVFLSIVLLTTFSTAGYLMLFMFYSYVIITFKIHFVFKWALILPFMVVLIYIYQNSNFLQEKVENQYEEESYAIQKNITDRGGRFYSIGVSVKSILSSPIIGRGVLTVNKYDVGERGRYGYGFIGMLAMYGIVFGLFYMLYFYRGFLTLSILYNSPKLFSLFAFFIINIGLLTQTFFFHTPFIYFFIIGLVLPFKKISALQDNLAQVTN